MAGNLADARDQVRQLKAAITGPRSISLVGCLILLPISAVLTAYTDKLRGLSLSEVLILTLSITAVDAILLVIADRTLLRHRRIRPVGLVTALFVYSVVSLARPATAYVIGMTFDPQPPFQPIRIIAGFAVTACGLSVLAVVMDSIYRHRKAVEELSQASADLENSRQFYTRQLEQERNLLDDAIRLRLGPVITQLGQALHIARQHPTVETTKLLANQISAVSRDTVRPLSHLLSYRTPVLSTTTVEAKSSPRRHRWKGLARETFLIAPFHPVLVPIITFIIAIGNTIRIWGVFWGIVSLTVDMIALGILLAILRRLLTRERLLRIRQWQRPIIVIASYVVATLTASLIALPLWLATQPFNSGQTFLGLFAIPLICLAAAITSAGTTSRQRALRELEAAVAARNWEVEYLRHEVEALSVRAGRRLHGSVQSQLSAVALALQACAELDPPDQTQREQSIDAALSVLTSMAAETEELLSASATQPVLSKALGEICQLWDGVISIHVDLDAETEQLAAQQGISSAVIEVVREAIQNASKHGSASQLEIAIGSSAFELTVQADDNGTNRNTTPGSGIGLAQLTEHGYAWTLTQSVLGGKRLMVKIPVFQPSPDSL